MLNSGMKNVYNVSLLKTYIFIHYYHNITLTLTLPKLIEH